MQKTTKKTTKKTFNPALPLKPRPERFCQLYLTSYNLTQAYKKAYQNSCSDNSCRVEGYRLLKIPTICQRLRYLQEQQAKAIDEGIKIDSQFLIGQVLNIQDIAMNRKKRQKRIVKTETDDVDLFGNVVYIETEEIVEVDDPDTQTMNKCIEQIAKIKGIYSDINNTINNSNEVNVTKIEI
jgi:phage terminase small subunit